MNILIKTSCFLMLACNALQADIIIAGKKPMIAHSDLIALVDIQELVSTDMTQIYVDLIAKGRVARTLKGDAKGEITFSIPRFFPDAGFDVSIGRHLVFLKENEQGEYEGINWFMSYVYLGDKTAKWFNEKDLIVDDFTPEYVVSDTENILKETP